MCEPNAHCQNNSQIHVNSLLFNLVWTKPRLIPSLDTADVLRTTIGFDTLCTVTHSSLLIRTTAHYEGGSHLWVMLHNKRALKSSWNKVILVEKLIFIWLQTFQLLLEAVIFFFFFKNDWCFKWRHMVQSVREGMHIFQWEIPGCLCRSSFL